ncbi:MAG: PQQ-dependent sugar dehydrogenase, partial [Niameybacter sp.]
MLNWFIIFYYHCYFPPYLIDFFIKIIVDHLLLKSQISFLDIDFKFAFDGAGKLWISSGERQEFDSAQDLTSNLGKMIRLNDDGSVASDNPFQTQGDIAKQIWSLG